MLSICIKCGSNKRRPHEKCRQCGFVPRTMEEKAQSLYLSRGVFSEEQRIEHPDFVPGDFSENRLLEISRQISGGQPYAYSAERLNKLLSQGAMVHSVTWNNIIWYLFRFFAPAVAVIVGLFVLTWFLKTLR
jgi:hypothetical protein